jgi:hypothetical protein
MNRDRGLDHFGGRFRFLSKIFLVDISVPIREERHHSAGSVCGRVGKNGKSARHLAIHHVTLFAAPWLLRMR